MTPAQMETFRKAMGVRAGPRMGPVRRARTLPARDLQAFLDARALRRERRAPPQRAADRRCRTRLPVTIQPAMSTQTGFGALLNEIGRGGRRTRASASSPPRPTSPSRPISAPGSTGAACSRARAMADTFKSERIPSTFNWEFSPKGQHIELGIAEMNLFLLLVGARPVALAQRRAAAADRHALRSVHRARPRCAELCLLSGRALHPGGDAVRHHAGAGRRRAPVDRARR